MPRRSLRACPRKPQASGLAADPGVGGGDPGSERGGDLRIPSWYLENLLLPVLPSVPQTPPIPLPLVTPSGLPNPAESLDLLSQPSETPSHIVLPPWPKDFRSHRPEISLAFSFFLQPIFSQRFVYIFRPCTCS